MVTPEVIWQFEDAGIGLIDPQQAAGWWSVNSRWGKRADVEVVLGRVPLKAESGFPLPRIAPVPNPRGTVTCECRLVTGQLPPFPTTGSMAVRCCPPRRKS